MPRYSKHQLDGFVADRRYWDRKHPDHDDWVGFTTKAFEETYPDRQTIVATPEQEAQSKREMERLRKMVALPAYRDKRDPGHAALLDEVTRGFDALNEAEFGPLESAASTPKQKDHDPLTPLDPAAFARKVAARPQTPAPLQAPNLLELGVRTGLTERRDTIFSGTEKPNATSEEVDKSVFGLIPPDTHRRNTRSTFNLTQNTPRQNPPKVIHPEITAPGGTDGAFVWSPLMVTPSQIEMLWKDLEEPERALDDFMKGFKDHQVRDPATGEMRPPTDEELKRWFEEWQQHIRDFLQDYHDKKDSLFPDEKERTPPLMEQQPENPIG
jgi:hypothetical protein